MNYKKQSVIISILSLIIAGLTAGVCYWRVWYLCEYGTSESIDVFLFLFSVPLFVLSLILRFLPNQVFNSWLRFAKYYLPIAAVLIFLSPVTDSSILGFDKEFMTWLLAGIFFITSLGIIIFKCSLGRPISK